MKIVAGEFKGKNLPYRMRRDVRVSSQLVKEAMFSMLSSKVAGARVLDLYCGSGSLGIEALSRGAEHVVFVDIDGQNLKQVSYFLDMLGIAERGETIKRDALKVIKHMEPGSFDIVIMDPPYHIKKNEKTLEAVDQGDILKENGFCVIEHYSKYGIPDKVGRLNRIKTKNYGDSSLSIFINGEPSFETREMPVANDGESDTKDPEKNDSEIDE